MGDVCDIRGLVVFMCCLRFIGGFFILLKWFDGL